MKQQTQNNDEYEFKGTVVNGFAMLGFTFLLIPALIIFLVFCCLETIPVIGGIAIGILVILFFLGCVGYFEQEPNVARVMIFFGEYKGTFRRVGFFWINPFISRKKLSLRIRNMDVEPIKVNDKVGNPVMIGMVLVWKIRDTYRVVFDLDSQSLGATGGISNAALDKVVCIQSDAALREVTSQFAYDDSETDDKELTLRDGGEEINDLLEHKLNDRLAMAGIEVVEARLNYLAYAPEIAAVMLRRQQASAIISAREKIVEGAVSMVEMALERLEGSRHVEMDKAQKAVMVSNLLVVLCGDEPVVPIVNASNPEA